MQTNLPLASPLREREMLKCFCLFSLNLTCLCLMQSIVIHTWHQNDMRRESHAKLRVYFLCWLSVCEIDTSDDKGLYKYTRLVTLRERCLVENSWDVYPAITNVFPVHPSYMDIVGLSSSGYSRICPLVHTRILAGAHIQISKSAHHPRGLCIELIVAKHSGH